MANDDFVSAGLVSKDIDYTSKNDFANASPDLAIANRAALDIAANRFKENK